MYKGGAEIFSAPDSFLFLLERFLVLFSTPLINMKDAPKEMQPTFYRNFNRCKEYNNTIGQSKFLTSQHFHAVTTTSGDEFFTSNENEPAYCTHKNLHQ